MYTFSPVFRVVQKNLVFVVGLTQRLADPEVRVMCTWTIAPCISMVKPAFLLKT